MSLHPYLTPFFLVDGSPTEGGSDSTKNQDAQTSYISVPPELPAPVVDIVRSQKNAYPVFYYNCSMDPVTEGNIQGAYSSSQPAGRWTYNNLPEMGIMPYKFQPLLKQDASSAKTKSEKSVIQKESSCCLHQNPAPCVYCAMRLQDGDLGALCRKDTENDEKSCIECVYAGRICTWTDLKPPEEGAMLVRARSYAIETIAKHGLDSQPGRMALRAMQTAAAQYLAAFWKDGNVYDLIGVQCLYNSSKAKRQRRITAKKKINRKQIHKGTNKDIEMSSYLNQSHGLVMGHLVLIREIMTCNRKISERLQKNNEILLEIAQRTPLG